MVRPQSQTGCFGEGKKYLVLQEVETRIVPSVAQSLYGLRHPGFSPLLLHESRPQLRETIRLLPRLLNIYPVRTTLAKLDRQAGKMTFNLQIKNE
jgi:hypothetical protein